MHQEPPARDTLAIDAAQLKALVDEAMVLSCKLIRLAQKAGVEIAPPPAKPAPQGVIDLAAYRNKRRSA
ncbi:hypothetical protein [Nonomuraea sp. NPDC049646]|uniref:hypothetical protein n=1 Tax=unclassified Nonomuraea TaxID=2593643 RepID=UPI003792E9B8